MKRIRHIWEYLTNPTYRAYCDLLLTQTAINALVNQQKDALLRSTFKPVVIDYADRTGLSYEEAETTLLAKYRH